MRNILRFSSAAAVLGACTLLNTAIAQPVDVPSPYGPPVETGGGPEIIAHRMNPNVMGGTAPMGSTAATSPILYHNNGPVIATPTAYVIWYGNWNRSNGTDTPAGQTIVEDFLKHIGGSPYFAINKNYTSGSGAVVSGEVVFGGTTSDAGSQGTRLSDSKVQAIVKNAISGGKLPADANGVYFVLTSSDVSETSGFCTRYCGWHTRANLSFTSGTYDIKYSFVGNAARCLNGCAIQSVGPNGNAGVDGMVSVIAHELEEATSDPDLNAWYDSGGAENADKCAWTFSGYQYLAPINNGSYANMNFTLSDGTVRDYMIQRNLFHGPAGDYCAISATAFDGAGNATLVK